MNIQEIYNIILESVPHFTGAGIIFCTKKGQVLLLKKNNKVWCLPGGKPNENETPKETALRETREETGKRAINLTEPLVLEYNNKTYYSFISIIQSPFDVILSSEHVDYKWAYLNELKNTRFIPPFKNNLKLIKQTLKKYIEI